jgi:hypothetical protein
VDQYAARLALLQTQQQGLTECEYLNVGTGLRVFSPAYVLSSTMQVICLDDANSMDIRNIPRDASQYDYETRMISANVGLSTACARVTYQCKNLHPSQDMYSVITQELVC